MSTTTRILFVIAAVALPGAAWAAEGQLRFFSDSASPPSVQIAFAPATDAYYAPSVESGRVAARPKRRSRSTSASRASSSSRSTTHSNRSAASTYQQSSYTDRQSSTAEAFEQTYQQHNESQSTTRRVRHQTTRRLASALYPEVIPTENPYGDLNDTRGLRPYKPGQKYDRQPERRGSLFGGLFGGR